jgi:glycosyltransferase involved in cell wall biosynthesis
LIRLLALMEAHTITGPAKNLLEFAKNSRHLNGTEQVEVEIATFQRVPGETPFTKAVRDAGIALHCIPEASAFDPGALKGLRGVVAAVKPDILQSHAVKSHFLVRASGLCKRHPWVASHHGYTHTDLRMRIYNQLDRWSLREAARVLTVSEAFRRQLCDLGIPRDRITVLHNAIDPVWGDRASDPVLRRSSRAALGIASSEKAILIVGRLSREKSHGSLIAAMNLLRSSEPSLRLRLIIVGDGPERPHIQQAAVQAGVQDLVIFAGQTADVLPHYAAADLAVLVSVTEGSPNALLEAMASRVPVVATSVGGIPEIITHGETGLLVPPGNVEQLASVIGQSLTDVEGAETMANKARTVVETAYSPEMRARFLTTFYTEATGRGRL